jgi:hypothetical protein
MQSVRKFTNRNRDTTSAEVIASFNQLCCFRIAEQPLQLPLFWGIAFLNFGATGL